MKRVMTRHPDPTKQGTRIDGAVYEAVKQAILEASKDMGEAGVAFSELPDEVARRTDPDLWTDRSVGWYTTTVKLDLEARGLIRRSNGRSPQRVHLT